MTCRTPSNSISPALNSAIRCTCGDIKYPKGVRPTHAADVVVVHIGRAGSGAELEAATEAAAAPAAKAAKA